MHKVGDVQVFIMCDEEGLRNNRLAFMCQLASLLNGVLDLSELPGF